MFSWLNHRRSLISRRVRRHCEGKAMRESQRRFYATRSFARAASSGAPKTALTNMLWSNGVIFCTGGRGTVCVCFPSALPGTSVSAGRLFEHTHLDGDSPLGWVVDGRATCTCISSYHQLCASNCSTLAALERPHASLRGCARTWPDAPTPPAPLSHSHSPDDAIGTLANHIDDIVVRTHVERSVHAVPCPVRRLKSEAVRGKQSTETRETVPIRGTATSASRRSNSHLQAGGSPHTSAHWRAASWLVQFRKSRPVAVFPKSHWRICRARGRSGDWTW